MGTGNFDPNGQVAVGTNGTVLCHGGLPDNVMVTYAPGGNEAGCSNFTQSGYQSYGVIDPPCWNWPATGPPCPLAQASQVQGCPGVLGTTLNGNLGYSLGSLVPGWGTLNPGVYVCDKPIVLNGTLTINASGSPTTNCADVADLQQQTSAPKDAACIWVELPAAINTNALPAIGVVQGSHINNATQPPSSSNFTPPVPVAGQLQLFTNSIGLVGAMGLANQPYYFAGVIYAPRAYLTLDGCGSVYYGSIVVNTITCNGAPNLSVYYDSALSLITTPWTVTNYSEIGSPQVKIP